MFYYELSTVEINSLTTVIHIRSGKDKDKLSLAGRLVFDVIKEKGAPEATTFINILQLGAQMACMIHDDCVEVTVYDILGKQVPPSLELLSASNNNPNQPTLDLSELSHGNLDAPIGEIINWD
ncbi:MAG: hypothetical protein ACRDUW_20555 [Pseudonocardiaceae bacterium]